MGLPYFSAYGASPWGCGEIDSPASNNEVARFLPDDGCPITPQLTTGLREPRPRQPPPLTHHLSARGIRYRGGRASPRAAPEATAFAYPPPLRSWNPVPGRASVPASRARGNRLRLPTTFPLVESVTGEGERPREPRPRQPLSHTHHLPARAIPFRAGIWG